MELKKGVKQTEVEAIPVDWDILPVSSLGEIKRGAGSQYIKYKTTGGVRLIRINDFFQENPVFVEPTDEIMRFSIHENDILFAGTGASAGASYLPKNEWVGLPHSYNAPRIRVNENCCKRYLLYSLQSNYVRKQQIAWFVGNAQPFLDTKAISSFSIAVPPLPEQKAIVEVLGDVDAYIESLEQLIEKKRQIKEGAIQELLTGNRRLTGFFEEWETQTISEIFTISTGVSKSLYIEDGGKYWIVDMGSVTRDGKLVVTKSTNYADDFLSKGDLVMPKDDIGGGNIIGKVGFIDCDGKYILGDHIYCLSSNNVNSRFFSYLINSYTINRKLREKVAGSAQLGLSRKSVEKQEITFPPLTEQNAIDEVLSVLDEEITQLEIKLSKTKQIKHGMMQELLTGKIRLI